MFQYFPLKIYQNIINAVYVFFFHVISYNKIHIDTKFTKYINNLKYKIKFYNIFGVICRTEYKMKS